MKIDTSLNIDYKKFKLSNGITCVVYPRKEIHSVSVKVNVKVGSLDEDEQTNGVSHFIEHVVHDGTKDLETWNIVDDFKTDISLNSNAYTSATHTQYYGTFPFQYLDKGLFFFSQLVLHPTFPEDQVNKERDIILDELKGGKDETDYYVLKNIKENRFTDATTSFSYDIIGTEKNLEKLTKQHLENFWRKHYIPENIEVYVVGNFEIVEIKEKLEKYFGVDYLQGTKPEKPKRNFETIFPEYSDFNISSERKLDLDKYYLTFTFPSLEMNHTTPEERIDLTFLKFLTASPAYFQSVLWKKLRQELGIVYGIFTWDYDMDSRSFIGIETSFNKEHLETVIREIYMGINRIKNGEEGKTVFEARKKKILDSQLMQLDEPMNVLNWIMSSEEEFDKHGKKMLVSDFLKYVQNLEYSKVQEVANKLLDWKKLNIGVVSAEETTEINSRVEKIWKSLF